MSIVPRTKNVPLNHVIPMSSPPTMSPITFAKLRIILSGAAEALESISVSLRLVAYTWLYESENSPCASGMAAAYPILFKIPKIRMIKNQSKRPNKSIDIHEMRTQENMTKNVPIFFERLISGICPPNAGMARIAINTYPVKSCNCVTILSLLFMILFKKSIKNVMTKVSQKPKNTILADIMRSLLLSGATARTS